MINHSLRDQSEHGYLDGSDGQNPNPLLAIHVACPFAHAKRALRPTVKALKGDATCINPLLIPTSYNFTPNPYKKCDLLAYMTMSCDQVSFSPITCQKVF